MLSSIEEPEKMEALAVPRAHAVAGAGVVTSRSPVLPDWPLRAENLERPRLDSRGTAAELPHLPVGERTSPECQVIDETAESAGGRPVRRTNQTRCGGLPKLAERPFLVDENAIDEELEPGAPTTDDDVSPAGLADHLEGDGQFEGAIRLLSTPRSIWRGDSEQKGEAAVLDVEAVTWGITVVAPGNKCTFIPAAETGAHGETHRVSRQQGRRGVSAIDFEPAALQRRREGVAAAQP